MQRKPADEKKSMLFKASGDGEVEMVKQLLAAGADCKATGEVGSLKQLLAARADVNTEHAPHTCGQNAMFVFE